MATSTPSSQELELLVDLAFWDLDIAISIMQTELIGHRNRIIRPSVSQKRALDRILLFDDHFARTHFRFTIPEIRTLAPLLKLHPHIKFSNRSTCTGFEALAMVLARLSFPKRVDVELVMLFGRSKAAISIIINETIIFLVSEFQSKLFFDEIYLKANVDKFCQIVSASGCPMQSIWGFVDGTAREIARPSRWQRPTYSGHKRRTCLKFQSIVTPDGLLWLYGPIEGRRHDSFLLLESNLKNILGSMPEFDGKYLYGDPGYCLSSIVINPYRNPTDDQKEFNRRMSSIRQNVEFGFMRITQLFGFFQYVPSLRLWSTPVGAYYLIGGLLTNCRTCMDGANIITSCFNSTPPSIEEYLL
jgi:hypothetical protein